MDEDVAVKKVHVRYLISWWVSWNKWNQFLQVTHHLCQSTCSVKELYTPLKTPQNTPLQTVLT